MKRRLGIIFPMMLLLLGAGIFLYPRFSSYIEHIRQAEVIQEYHEASQTISKEEYERMLAEAQAYNQMLAEQPDFDHAVGIARAQHSEEYKTLLDIRGNGVMGSVRIPKIGVELPLYHGTEEKDLAKGVGHYEGTSLPVGGESTHAVLSGHRGLPSADLFTRLDEVESGDYFVINTLGVDITYQVDQIKTVLPDQTDDLTIVKGKDYATLVTCTPYGINSHRLLIRGIRTANVALEEGDEDRTGLEGLGIQNRELLELLKYSAVVVLILLLTAIILWITRKRNKQESGKGKG